MSLLLKATIYIQVADAYILLRSVVSRDGNKPSVALMMDANEPSRKRVMMLGYDERIVFISSCLY